MITQGEISEIVSAYFTARETDGKDYEANHKIVVDILNRYPEYANFFLTSEERGDDE